MEHETTDRRTVETEFRKGMLRSRVPIGLIITALGIGMVVLIGSYLMKYFRGAIPLREVYRTEQAGEEYVSFDIDYVLDVFMESYRTLLWSTVQEQRILSGAGRGGWTCPCPRFRENGGGNGPDHGRDLGLLKRCPSCAAYWDACGRNLEKTEG